MQRWTELNIQLNVQLNILPILHGKMKESAELDIQLS